MTKDIIQQKITEQLNNPCHGILLLAPRIGKTKIAIDIIKREECKSILWVTPSTSLRDKDIPNEFIKWGAKDYLKKTTVICWQSLWCKRGNYDKIILDEYQHITRNNSIMLIERKLQYKSILCLSGTHPENEIKKGILEHLDLNIIDELNINSAVEKNIISDYKLHVLKTKLDDKNKNVLCGNNRVKFMSTEKKQYDYLTEKINKISEQGGNTKTLTLKRMRLIYNSKTKENIARYLISKLKGKKLIFAGSIEQSNRLSTYTFNSKTSKDFLIKFNNNEIDTLVCVNSGGTGFTFENINHVIIIQSNSNKNGVITQKLSRGLLKNGEFLVKLWVLCLSKTQDELWMKSSLSCFDEDKISYHTWGVKQKNEYD